MSHQKMSDPSFMMLIKRNPRRRRAKLTVRKSGPPLISTVGPKKHSLREMAWLPVVQDGYTRRVNLDDALIHAHLIDDLEVLDPIERFSALRFLCALTACIIR